MKIVIEIDDARFKDIRRIACVQLENHHFKTVEQIIANGTPLPKSHGDLIDKSELTTVTEIKPDGSECTYVPYSEIENANVVVEADKED